VSFWSINLILSLIWVKTKRSKNSISKNNSQLFHINSNEDKLYIKVVALNAIYNFTVEKFFIKNRLVPENLILNFKFIDLKTFKK